jgi:hypothetical protein
MQPCLLLARFFTRTFKRYRVFTIIYTSRQSKAWHTPELTQVGSSEGRILLLPLHERCIFIDFSVRRDIGLFEEETGLVYLPVTLVFLGIIGRLSVPVGSAIIPKTPIGSWEFLFPLPLLSVKRAVLHILTGKHG